MKLSLAGIALLVALLSGWTKADCADSPGLSLELRSITVRSASTAPYRKGVVEFSIRNTSTNRQIYPLFVAFNTAKWREIVSNHNPPLSAEFTKISYRWLDANKRVVTQGSLDYWQAVRADLQPKSQFDGWAPIDLPASSGLYSFELCCDNTTLLDADKLGGAMHPLVQYEILCVKQNVKIRKSFALLPCAKLGKCPLSRLRRTIPCRLL
jgi:hypothetical protein